MPAERATFTAVPGRSGTLTTLEGDDVYDDLILTATCYIDSPERVPAVCAWLKGGGTVTFANRPGGHYKARVVNQIPFEKILRGNPHRSFVVNFRCSPFWYADDVPPITLTASGMAIAERMLDRHHTLTNFLMALGIDAATAETDACKIEHDISQKTFDAICAHAKAHL